MRSSTRLRLLNKRLNEGKALPVGHLSRRKDGDYKKQANGKWERVLNTNTGVTKIPSGSLSPSEAHHHNLRVVNKSQADISTGAADPADLEWLDDSYVKIPVTDSPLAKSPVDHSKTKKLGGGQNIAEVLTIDTPDGPVQAVWKSVAGEKKKLRTNIEPGSFYTREAAAYQVAKAIGVDDLVPETAAREVDGEMGSVQRFVKTKELAGTEVWDTPPDEYTTQVQIGKEDSQRMRIFDFITGNTDRHYGNILHKETANPTIRKPVLIDNGLAFPAGPPDMFIQPTLQYQTQHGAISQSAVKWIKSIKPEPLVSILREHKIEEEAIRQTLYRLKLLQSDPQVLAFGKKTRELDTQRWFRAAVTAQDKLTVKQLDHVEKLLGNR